jgi:hypothetical protein
MHGRPDDGGVGLTRQPRGVLVRVKMSHGHDEESRQRGPHIHRHLTRRSATAALHVRDEQLEAGSGDVDGEEGAPNQHKPGGWGSTARAMTSLVIISRFLEYRPSEYKRLAHNCVTYSSTRPLSHQAFATALRTRVSRGHAPHPPPPPPPLQKLFNPPI